MKRPRVFISYAWEDEESNNWIQEFANTLKNKGIDVHFDRNGLNFGDSISGFIDNNLEKADFIIVICTKKYKEKSDARIGGVGYEVNIIANQMMNDKSKQKIIPILREKSPETSIPLFLSGKYYIDFSSQEKYSENLKKLVDFLKDDKRESVSNTCNRKVDILFPGSVYTVYNEITILDHSITKLEVPYLNKPELSNYIKCVFTLSSSPSDVWEVFFHQNWKKNNFENPSKVLILENEIILNGFLNQNLISFYKDKISQCVAEANKDEKNYLNENRRFKLREHRRRKRKI